MSNVSVQMLFCDDVRHETGGKASLMGVFGAINEYSRQSPLRFTCVAFVTCGLDDDLSETNIALEVSLDGATPPTVHKFGPLPPKAPLDSVAETFVELFRKDLPGGQVRTQLLGRISAEGVKFKKSCLLIGLVNGKEVSRALLFNADAPVTKAPKKSTNAKPKVQSKRKPLSKT